MFYEKTHYRRFIISIISVITRRFFTRGFTRSLLTNRIYHPQNVYEEIWNLVVTEEWTSKQTVLTTATKDAHVVYDFGMFQSIYIPESHVTISWWSTNSQRELSFLFPRPDEDSDYVQFIYNYEAETLYGNTEFSYLLENFLTDYFRWCEDAADFSSDYSIASLDDTPFQYVNPL